MEAVVFLAFPLSLKMHPHLQVPLMYYYRDPPPDKYHLVESLPEKKPADQQEKNPCQSTYLSCMK